MNTPTHSLFQIKNIYWNTKTPSPYIIHFILFTHRVDTIGAQKHQTKRPRCSTMSSWRSCTLRAIIILSDALTALFSSDVLLQDLCRQLINNKLIDASSSQQRRPRRFWKQQLCCRSRSGFGVPARLARRRINQVLESQFLQRLLGHQLAEEHEETKRIIQIWWNAAWNNSGQ